MESNFIKLHRKMLYWEWYKDNNTKILFLHFLLNASLIDIKWKGIDIKRGQFITSLSELSKEINLSSMQVRVAIEKLKTSKEIEVKTTNKYTIISICKFDYYNNNESKDTNQPEKSQKVENGNEKIENGNENENEGVGKKQEIPKKEKREINVPKPTFEEFKDYAEQKAKENNLDLDVVKVKLKYEAWKTAKWVNGNGRRIKSWRASLLNTLKYLEKDKNFTEKKKDFDTWVDNQDFENYKF